MLVVLHDKITIDQQTLKKKKLFFNTMIGFSDSTGHHFTSL